MKLFRPFCQAFELIHYFASVANTVAMDFDIEMDDVPVDTAPVPEVYTEDIVVGEEQVCSTHGNRTY